MLCDSTNLHINKFSATFFFIKYHSHAAIPWFPNTIQVSDLHFAQAKGSNSRPLYVRETPVAAGLQTCRASIVYKG